MDRVAAHHLRARDQLKIGKVAVGANSILEDNVVTRRNRPVRLRPDVTLQQRPHPHVAKTPGLAGQRLPHLDAQVAFRIAQDRPDWPPVLRRQARALARLELRLTHAARSPARAAEPFVRGRVTTLEAGRGTHMVASPQAAGLGAGEILGRLLHAQLIRQPVYAAHVAVQQRRYLRGRYMRIQPAHDLLLVLGPEPLRHWPSPQIISPPL